MVQVRFSKGKHKGKDRLTVSKGGYSLLQNPIANKGTGFTEEERTLLGLRGLLPFQCEAIEVQVARAYREYSQLKTNIGKHIYLRNILEENETLFYRIMLAHITEMMPIVYTPTVGQVCEQYSQIFHKARGLYLSYPEEQNIEAILDQCSNNIEVIVVTDGERILGLGDLGVGGIGIPTFKLALYTLCGGIHPSKTLPIILDTGTDNKEKIADPYYLGYRHPRVRGEAYDIFVDKFVQAVKKRWPDVLLQWEDFAKQNARILLDRYREVLCSFNDDIQGTAAVTIAGLLAASKASGSRMRDQRIVIFGGGTAGTGIADQLVTTMMLEGLTKAEAISRIFILDREGLIVASQTNVESYQRRYARPTEDFAHWQIPHGYLIDLENVVDNIHPTILIGASAQPCSFTESVIRKMADYVERPIIFPLSNPQSKCEADPEDLISWTKGKAIIATGSPYPNVHYEGDVFPIGQCNNSYIFPGIGLGTIASKATKVTDEMIMSAAYALCDCSPMLTQPHAALFPPLEKVREVSQKIALAVGLAAISSGVAQPMEKEELMQRIEENVWFPNYPEMVLIPD